MDTYMTALDRMDARTVATLMKINQRNMFGSYEEYREWLALKGEVPGPEYIGQRVKRVAEEILARVR